MIKIAEWFGGIGAFTQAVKRKNIPHILEDYVELDKHAVNSYNGINGTNFEPTDINDIDTINYPELDLLVAGWPCLLPNTLVKTSKGFKEIQNIVKGDYVRTHKGNWKQVEASWETGKKEIWKLRSQLNDVHTTDNHKWYVLRDNKHQWVRTDELSVKDKMIHEINSNSIDKTDLTDDELFILGVYAGDGNTFKDGTNKALNGISLTVANKQVDEIINHWGTANVYKKTNTNKAVRIDIRSRELAQKAIKYIGQYSHLKEIHNDIIDLPVDKLKLFFDGYMKADGSKDKLRNRYSFTTVSKKMALGLQEIALKLFRVPVNWIERVRTKGTWGKRIKYKLDFTTPNRVNNLDKYFYANIKSIVNTKVEEVVWDINVKDDHSFYANNMITHNCQDYSVAGKGLGLDGTRSSLILLTISKIKEMVNKPKHILLENVKGLLSKKHIEDLEYIKELFDGLGYNWDQALLNSKYFGVPQARERVFMLLTRKDLVKKSIKHLEERKQVDKILADVLDFTEPTNTITIETLLESDYGKGVKMEYSNYIYLPPVNPEKPLNNLEGIRLWKSDKYVGTIPAGSPPKIYFTNELRQYHGNTIQLDMGTLESQKRDIINRVGILGTLTKEPLKHQKKPQQKIHDINGEDKLVEIAYANSRDVVGTSGVYGTLAARTPNDNSTIIFKSTKFKDDSIFQGIEGQAKTLLASSPRFKGKVLFPKGSVIHYRKLSVLECWRLMGFDDEVHNKLKLLTYTLKSGKEKRLISDVQLAKQAGNSIVVNVLEAILEEIFPIEEVELDDLL